MTGDPATQEWRQAVGESTSARLRRVEEERDLARAQLDVSIADRALLRDLLIETDRRFYVARQDAGVCVDCGGPIVRGQAVEARHDSTTEPEWFHAVCPIQGRRHR